MANKDKKEDDFKYIVRMASIDIDGNKKIPIGISKVRGIGARTGLILCNLLNLDPDKKVGYLTDEEVKILSESLDSLGKKICLFGY